jgi:hypothetical protein
MKITPKAADAIASAYSDRAMYMAQAEASGVSPDVAADEWKSAQKADEAIEFELGVAILSAKLVGDIAQ